MFSDIPTDKEIEKIRAEYEMKKELEGIDVGAVNAAGKKRRAAALASESATAAEMGATSSSSASSSSSSSAGRAGGGDSATNAKIRKIVPGPSQQTVKRPTQYNSSDEEADF